MRPVLALVCAAIVVPWAATAQESDAVPRSWDVTPGSPTAIQDAVRRASDGDTLLLNAGVYTEDATIHVDKRLTILGLGDPVLDGSNAGQIMLVTADSVQIRGLGFRNVGRSFVEDDAAVKVDRGNDCRIEGNRFEDTFFGIYLANSGGCRVINNRLQASEQRETFSGNGIHLWYSQDVSIQNNEVRGFRDGVYFEFVENSQVADNISEGNLRYGLHFMFSDGCVYTRNRFHDNGAGVAVMYTDDVVMTENDFDRNWGTAAFGLLLKDITDSRIEGNRFRENSIALHAEGGARLTVSGNEFRDNGWAVKVLANVEDTQFSGNNFIGNSFDVATNSRNSEGDFTGNFWSEYRGYDLDRDGRGDVPHRPVRLFSLLVERNEPTLVLLRSFMVQLLDVAESLIPALTPEALLDPSPAMQPFNTGWSGS